MKKFYLIFGIIAGAMLLCGTALAGIGIAAGADKKVEIPHVFNIDYSGVAEGQKEYIETEAFDSIKADVNIGKIDIVEGDAYAVEYETYNGNLECDVKNGVLYITQKKENTLFNLDLSWINGFDGYYVKITVPSEEQTFKKIDINADMGAVNINISGKADCIYVDADMGDIEISNISVCDMELDADMGNIIYRGSTYDSGKIIVNSDMGNVELTGYLACDVEVDCDMGNAEVTTYYNSDCYEFDVDCDMGHSEINKNGGKTCDERYKLYINCDLGNAELTFANP